MRVVIAKTPMKNKTRICHKYVIYSIFMTHGYNEHDHNFTGKKLRFGEAKALLEGGA